jgi:glutamate synthase (NADPH/NADH) small chain
METFYDAGGRLALRGREERSERVACIGAGPASLACAAELRQQGFSVTVIDRRARPGGLNTYGVAEYKLRAADSLREVEMVRGLGVEFEVRDVDAAGLIEIEREFDAVFLGVGLGAMHRLDVAGADDGSERMIDALEFIAQYKTAGLEDRGGMNPPIAMRPRWMGHPDLRCVVVIGAGNTAMDAARAAKRLGAETVTILYRRQREDIPAFDLEYERALGEGVEFVWATQPTAMERKGDGVALTCVAVAQDAAGQLTPVAGSEFTIECDAVIPAIGQSPLLELLSQVRGVTMDRGRVEIDRASGQTANPKYFAGGDCVNGGREVVDAVADGKRAAVGIAAWLCAKTEARIG